MTTLRIFTLAAICTLAACEHDSNTGKKVTDAGITIDLANPPDLTTLPDLTSVVDLTQATDLLKPNCSPPLVHVPFDCPTIQKAVDVAITAKLGPPLLTIFVDPGIYRENITVGKDVNITIVKGCVRCMGDVVIDGGARSAISLGENSTLELRELIVTSQQVHQNYTSATIFAEFSHLLKLIIVTVRTTSIGISVNYTDGTRIENSTISSDSGPNTVGIELDHQNIPGPGDQGAHIYNNTFNNLHWAMTRCSGNPPELAPNGGMDSNQYPGVPVPYYFDPNCQ